MSLSKSVYFKYMLAGVVVIVMLIALRHKPAHPAGGLIIDAPNYAVVFDKWEATVTFSEALAPFRLLSNTQVNDAYDADRDGRFIRIQAHFTHESGHRMTVPGFAMKPMPDSPWIHTIRWSPDRAGDWTAAVSFHGSTGLKVLHFEQTLAAPIKAKAVPGIAGSLVAPEKSLENPNYLRQKLVDGRSKPVMLYGTCRSWSIRQPVTDSTWADDELIHREQELFTPMRRHGMNLLNQWMAPWEYLLVHHARAEHWEQQDGNFVTVPVPAEQAWSSHQYYDQGRAAAFDRLVTDCEGDAKTPTIRLLLAPLPHPLFRQNIHPWSEGYSFWSPWENPDLPANSMNGFCTSESMEAWDFFDANPRLPLTDSRSKAFDHQANFFRYLIARWGYSRALGAWVILDEIEGIGDEEAYLPEKNGFWGHPQCQRWLNDINRLFNGRLKRSADNEVYAGDAFNHPTSAATSSTRGDYTRGSNLDWSGGDYDAVPDLQGWHWYPPISPPIFNWWKVWKLNLAGVMSYSHAPLENRPRLITEFGAKDRQTPTAYPSSLYPSIYHFAAWASALSGQAGTVMEWNDGKEFGEFFPKGSGAFSAKNYPIFPANSLLPLQAFMGQLDLDTLMPVNRAGSVLSCSLKPGGIATGLTTSTQNQFWGWLFSPDTRHDTLLEVRGLEPGDYFLRFYDTWSGDMVNQQTLTIKSREITTGIDIQTILYSLPQKGRFPYLTREYKGHDLAIAIVPATTPTED